MRRIVAVLLGLVFAATFAWAGPPAAPWDSIDDPDELFALATRAALDGRGHDAVAIHRRFLRLHPDHAAIPEVLYALGHALESADRAEEAIDAWRDLARNFPERADADDCLHRIAACFAARAERQAGENRSLAERLQQQKEAEWLRLPARGTEEERARARAEVEARWDALSVPGARLEAEYRRQALAAYADLLARFPRGRHGQEAEHWLARFENRDVDLDVERSFRTDEEIVLPFRHRHMGTARLQVRRIPARTVIDRVQERRNADLARLFDPEDVARIPPVVERTLRLWSAGTDVAGELRLGRLDAGLYLVQVEESYFRAWVPLLVTDLAMLEAAQGDQAAALLVDFATGAPFPEAHLFTIPRAGEGEKPGEVQAVEVADGLGRYGLPSRGAVLFAHGGEHLASTEGRWSNAAAPRVASGAVNLVYTDRPLYRPGHRVHYRAILRTLAEGGYDLPGDEAVTVEVQDPRGNVVHRESKVPDAFGCLSGSFDLAADGATGSFHVRLSAGGSGSFHVESYRLPPYALTAQPRQEAYLSRETVELDLEARHFHGRPVEGASIRLDVRPSLWGPHPNLRSPRALPWVDCDGYPPRIRADETLTDASGKAVARFRVPTWTGEAVHQVRVTALDRTRRPVAAWVDVPVHPGSLALVLEADGPPQPEQAWSFFARVIRLDGSPAPDVRVAVALSRARREGDKELFDPIASIEGTTASDGTAAFVVQPGDRGLLRAIASVTDPEGRSIRFATDVWVGGWRRSREPGPTLATRLDREDYDLGQEAALEIENSAGAGSAFLVVAGRGLDRVERIELAEGTTRVPLKVESAWFPGVTVEVAVVRQGRRISSRETLRVSPRARTLAVSVTTDREAYVPGETARCRISVRDADGRPAVAQLSLGIVDEAVYALREDSTPDLAKRFHAFPWSAPSWRDAFAFVAHGSIDYISVGGGAGGKFGGRLGGRRNLIARGGGCASTESARPRVHFPDTLYWNAAVTTGADGTAEVAVPIADAITRYRIVARAVTADTQAGSATAALRVDQPFFVQLVAPRHFVRGDRATVSAVVHAAAGATEPVALSLEVEGATLEGEAACTVPAEQAAHGRTDWLLRVDDTRSVRLVCRARQGAFEDAMEIAVPVDGLGPARPDGIAGRAEGRSAEKVMLSRNDRLRTRDLRLVLTAGKSGAVLESLEYLAGYPYGCVEQTLSRFLPSVAYQRTLQALGRPPAPALRELPRMVSLGLQRLYALQSHQGGWGWWKDDEVGVLLTAHVLRGLEQARAAGIAVDADAIGRARLWLRGRAKELQDPVLLAAIACAVAGEDELAQEAADRAWAARERDGMTAHGRALLVSALARSGRPEHAAAVADALRREAIASGRGVFWRAQAPRTSWMDSDVEATGDAVRALLAVDPADPLAARAVDWILAARRMGRWGSTRTTAAAVFACAELLVAAPEPTDPPGCRVLWNGTLLHDGPVGTADAPVVRIPIPADALHDGSNELDVAVAGRGGVDYDLRWEEEDLAADFAPRSSAGVDVTRTYHRLRPTGKDGALEADPAPIPDGETVAAGDEIEVRLAMDSVRDYEFLLLEDPKPAGFEWVEWRDPCATWCDAFDDRTAFCFTRLREGTTELRYRLRAETPGAFGVGPAVLTHMYSDRIFAHSASQRVKIE